jgi:hypothetical protein
MRIECIVVNASPLICLFKSGLSDILPSLFAEIVVPDKVHQEITAKSGIDLSSIMVIRNFYKRSLPYGKRGIASPDFRHKNEERFSYFQFLKKAHRS